MIATYNDYVIEALPGEGGWITTINGIESGIKPAKYKGWAIKWAMQSLQEQERIQEPMRLKEMGL
jgi:hypothetical protein